MLSMKGLKYSTHYKACKKNKNSTLYKVDSKVLESILITPQIRVAQMIPTHGIYLSVRDNSNWLKCTTHYFKKANRKGVYVGTLRTELGDTFMILHFPNGDGVLNILEFKVGYKPNLKAIAQMVAKLSE